MKSAQLYWQLLLVICYCGLFSSTQINFIKAARNAYCLKDEERKAPRYCSGYDINFKSIIGIASHQMRLVVM